jgi:uncharacterized Ntn-hydrolase superfamily protein
MINLSTFSIGARCRRSGMIGFAISTAVPAVGGLVPFVARNVGVVATQSWLNPYFGIDGLDLLRAGLSARETLDRLLAGDSGREYRQLGIVDANGGTAVFTGASCVDWAGHIEGDGFTVQGNMLVGEATIAAMAEAFEKSEPFDLHDRLMLALEAGQSAGGDKRGKQSASLKVFRTEDYPYLDIRVDEHRHPVAELRRVFEVARQQLLPFVDHMPTRDDTIGRPPPEVAAMIMTPPPFRPGGSGGA